MNESIFKRRASIVVLIAGVLFLGTGDYVIVVAPTRGNATYRLKVEIR